jgi:hypothetical protein
LSEGTWEEIAQKKGKMMKENLEEKKRQQNRNK